MTHEEIQAARALVDEVQRTDAVHGIGMMRVRLTAKLTLALDALEASRRECEELRHDRDKQFNELRDAREEADAYREHTAECRRLAKEAAAMLSGDTNLAIYDAVYDALVLLREIFPPEVEL